MLYGANRWNVKFYLSFRGIPKTNGHIKETLMFSYLGLCFSYQRQWQMTLAVWSIHIHIHHIMLWYVLCSVELCWGALCFVMCYVTLSWGFLCGAVFMFLVLSGDQSVTVTYVLCTSLMYCMYCAVFCLYWALMLCAVYACCRVFYCVVLSCGKYRFLKLEAKLLCLQMTDTGIAIGPVLQLVQGAVLCLYFVLSCAFVLCAVYTLLCLYYFVLCVAQLVSQTQD